jgi:hypothetical protein
MRPWPILLLCCACPSPGPLADCAPTRSCSDVAPEVICIDSELPQEPVLQGVRMWASVLCDQRRFVVQVIDGAQPVPADCHYTVLLALSTWPWVQAAPPGTMAFAEVDRGVAWIVTDVCPPALLRAATAHELGALLGATDDLGPGVMQGTLTDTCIAQHSVDEVLQ